ncbi:MAG: hypothetical protein AAFP81_07980 [Pseudomonadota bacterium]
MSFGRKHIVGAMWLLALAWTAAILPTLKAYADLGDRVTNVATVSQSTENGVLVFPTNEAVFTIEARRTPSDIEFFRIVESAPDATPVFLNGSDYSPSGKPLGPFLPIGESPLLNFKSETSSNRGSGGGTSASPAANSSGKADITKKSLNSSTEVSIVPAQTYLAGELMVIRVIDEGQNGDPNQIETVVTEVTADNGDRITLRLYEDTPDSGNFYGFFPTTASPTPSNDRFMTAPQDTMLTAKYVDAFDATEVSVDTAAVDPFGRVFDSYTGEPLNGVSVTILDADTGLPAEIMGIDGAGTFPSTVQTGVPLSDSSGITYPVTDGVFFFPLLAPGRYRLEVRTPEGYVYPSSRSISEIQNIDNARYELRSDASFAQSFEVFSSGPVNIDLPIDPSGDLVIRKRAAEPQAAIGDFIGYTIELENSGTIPAPFALSDTLPTGLRYVQGTARVDQQLFADPDTSADGQVLTFAGGLVLPGSTIRLTYLAAVGPGTPSGIAVNRAVALDGNGVPVSNATEAAVQIEEDLLTSRLTIVGRVAEAACAPDQSWARSILDGDGVGGVRLYMETGEYVVTDENGLYHFEGVTPGTHVVQVDEATLPAGYEPVVCEENTRYAGSALSKFVDAQGGSIWRANFYLRKTNAVTKVDTVDVGSTRSEDLYDETWLNAQENDGLEWVYPALGQTPNGRSVELGILHGSNQRVRLELNGVTVPRLNFSGRDLADTRDVAVSRWAGVDIQRGQNKFVAVLLDLDGNELERMERDIWFVDEVDRAYLVDDQSVLVADGRTKPTVAVRLESGDGHAVHEGRIVDIQVAEPYRLAQEAEDEFESPVDAGFSAVAGVRVGPDGIARVELEPTLESGRVRLQVRLQDGSLEDINVWLAPEKRDWIVVGLAEADGMAAKLEDASGRKVDDFSSDGRLAFFAKGVIKGDWLLTVAIDTAKRRGAQDGEIFNRIDPNAYYTLYGDRTWQYDDAESRYPVYLKLEKNTFQAVFGDFETGFAETELGRYSRRLSGLKADYDSETASITAFAAETNQTFMKDEIAADGTSGPYRLRSAPLVRSSEVITVETRDRLRPDQVLSILPLNRYIDYEIDYVTGELFFRQPVAATDSGLNPNVIVIDYETSDQGDRGVTAGLRAAARMADGRIQTGLTLIHEEDGSTRDAAGSELLAADLTVALNEKTEVRAEYATSESRLETGDESGEALLVEATRRSETVSMTGYFREESAGFGLGQQASSTSALRRVGAQLSAELGVLDAVDGSDRTVRKMNAQGYYERNLSQLSERSVADIVLQQDSQTLGVSAGLRAVSESFDGTDETRQSVLLLAGLRKTFVEQGLTISAVWEEPVTSNSKNDDEATLFPGRAVLGVDKTLGNRATASIRHEITDGQNASGQNTVAGLTWEPLSGTQLRAASDIITNESGRRIGATVGVDQVWQVNDAWTLGGGLARRANVDGTETPRDVTADAAISPLADGVRSPLTLSDQFTSGYVGASYQAAGMAGSGRVELRDSTEGTRLVATLGGAREITKTLSFSGAARHQQENLSGQGNRDETDVRLGAAWRPRGEGVVVLNRFDVGRLSEQGVQERSKIVNNLAVNAMVTKQTQLSVYHGVKRVETDFEGASAEGTTHLLGAEVRHDVYKGVDVGLQTTWASSDASGTETWSFGPSVGFSPEDNIWVSLGWNVSGFDDADFEAAKYRNEGPYIKLRAKFDQNTAKGLIKKLGLGAE